MATIDNRSNYLVSWRDGQQPRTQAFPYSARARVEACVAGLRASGYRPRVARADDCFQVRIRQTGFPALIVTVASADDADTLVDTIRSERKRGLFIDYTQAWKVTFAELLARYLRKEAPRHKASGFEMEVYKINALLEDAGVARLDLAEVARTHPAPHPTVAAMKLRRQTGIKMRTSAINVQWLHKPFAMLRPADFGDYIDERCQAVEPATVDREVDIFSRVCSLPIDTWRIEVAKSPMDGVRPPKYFNERDRRLKPGEEERLVAAARDEDRRRAVAARLEELMADARTDAELAPTTYQQKAIIRDARQRLMAEAEATLHHRATHRGSAALAADDGGPAQ